MSPEERRLLTDLFDRVAGAAGAPRDHEAEELIAQKLREQPYAAYFLAQAVIIQDHALQATTDRVQELEDEVQRLESDTAARPQSGSFLHGLGSLFGNSQPSASPRDTYAQRQGRLYDDYSRMNREPEPAPSPWGRSGAAGPWGQSTNMSSSGGFLSGALTTAAGVAGGVLAADAIRDLFSPHLGGTGNPVNGLFGNTGNTPVEETVVNNFFGNDAKSDDRDDKSNDRDDVQQVNDSGDDNDNDDFDVADLGGGDDSFA